MGSLHLHRRLFTIGSQARKHTESGAIRAGALLLAALTLTITLLSMTVVSVLYAGKADRALARTTAVDESNEDAELLWAMTDDILEDGRQFGVIFIEPLSTDAPVPPGVTNWPGPGEVLMSPGLLAAGESEGIAHRYGELVGMIGESGLTDPGEKLVYVHPVGGVDVEGARHVVGFGPDEGELYYSIDFGIDQDRPQWAFQGLIAGMLLMPSLLLLFVACRTASQQRDRRAVLVAVLGGRRMDRAAISAGDAWRPITLGTVLAVVFAVTVIATEATVPITGYQISFADLRSAWPLLLAVVGLAWAIAMTSTVFLDRATTSGNSTRPVPSRGRATHVLAALFPVMVLITMLGPQLFGVGTGAPRPAYILTYWFGAIGTAITMPAAIAVSTAYLGAALARRGAHRRRPGQLVAGRRINAHPGPTARMVSGLTIGLFVLMQALAWQGAFASQAVRGQALIDYIGYSTVEVAPRGEVSTEQISEFTDALPPDAQLLGLTVGVESNELVAILHGDCPALTTAAIPCGVDGRTIPVEELPPAIQAAVRGVPPVIHETSNAAAQIADSDDTRMIVTLPPGDEFSIPAVKDVAYRTFPLGAKVEVPGMSTLSGGAPNRDQALWTVLIGVIAVGVAAVVAALASAAEYLRHGKAIAPLTSIAGDFRVFRGYAAWSIFMPIALAGAAGTVVGSWIAFPVDDVGAQLITTELILTCIGAITVIGALVTVVAGATAIRQAQIWVPRGD